MSTRNIPIQQGIMSIQNKLEEQVIRIGEMYKLLNKDIIAQNKHNEKTVIELDNLVNVTQSKIASDCIYELTKSAFAKDLRRIIAYLQISDKLEDMSDRVLNIYKFYTLLSKKYKMSFSEIDNQLISEMISKVERRIKQLAKIIISEDEKQALFLIKSDASINKFYVQIIEQLSSKKIIKSKTLSPDKRSEVQFGFMLAIKNIERSGDDIKSMAKSIIFIN